MAQPISYLIDALACAIAYESLELMDAQHDWLRQAMSPRCIQPHLLNKHFQVFNRTVEKNLSKDMIESGDDLLKRLQN